MGPPDFYFGFFDEWKGEATSLWSRKQGSSSCRSWASVVSTRQHSLHSIINHPMPNEIHVSNSTPNMITVLKFCCKTPETPQRETNKHLPNATAQNNSSVLALKNPKLHRCNLIKLCGFFLLSVQFSVLVPTTWLGFPLVIVLSSHKHHTVLSNKTTVPLGCLLSVQTTQWPGQLCVL